MCKLNPGQIFNELEVDTLQELMNIAFGKAAAELAETIDIIVELNVPKIKLIKISLIPAYIESEIKNFDESSVVEQFYKGEISGAAYLIFPYGVERDFISLFQDQDINTLKSDILIELEKEILLEVGNILIGACLGKLFNLFDGTSTLLSPRSIQGESFQQSFIQGAFGEEDFAIVMQTKFSFEDRNVSGNLIILNHQETVPNVKTALKKYWAQYT